MRKLLISTAQGRIDENCQYQKSNEHAQIEKHKISRNIFRVYHLLTPFTMIKLKTQHTKVAIKANHTTTIPILSIPRKNGTTTEAKRTSPITINISDNLFSCESVNNSNMATNTKTVNDDVLFSFADGDHRKLLLKKKQELLQRRRSFPLLITSLLCKNKYANNNKQNTLTAKNNSPEEREFFKEIARYSNNKNRFAQVSHSFGNKLYSIFMKPIHSRQSSIESLFCQEKLWKTLKKVSI